MNEHNNLSFRILVVITTPKLGEKVAEMLTAGRIPINYRLSAVGTATSEMMDILGLGTPDKSVLISILPTAFTNVMLEKLKNETELTKRGNGIAFTLTMAGANNHILKMLQQINSENSNYRTERDEHEMAETKKYMIAAVVNHGYSEDVMNAAKAVGATGGTVLHGGRIGDEEALSFWGLSMQAEKEIVLIIADKENKTEIMQAVSTKCGVHSEAKGIVVSMPIDSVIGLGEH